MYIDVPLELVMLKPLSVHVAPEVLVGEVVSMQTDMWSLGVLVYTL